MATIAQGDVWWAELAESKGSEPGFRRPVVIVQGDDFNRSRIGTVVCVPLTTNLDLADLPGNVRVESARGASLASRSRTHRRSSRRIVRCCAAGPAV